MYSYARRSIYKNNIYIFIKLNWKYSCLIYNSKDTFLFEALDAYKSISIEKKLIKLTTRYIEGKLRNIGMFLFIISLKR